MAKNTLEKLIVLADAAKYDASCASSGGARRDSRDQKGIGSSGGMGICHSYAPDGRCISLLKLLLTNWCIFDCLYCVNRQSSNVERARFTVNEVVNLTLDFYKRNVIEGLFLSSGIIQTPDYTMEQLIEVARCLREDHHFRGYIHLKTIPNASPDLIARAGVHADRLSINVELPTEDALIRLAPEKNAADIALSMERIRNRSDESREEQNAARKITSLTGAKPNRKVVRFAPAGQSTQMIVGADDSSDRHILAKSTELYRKFRLRRVYYSAFSPIPHASAALPSRGAPLLREHRLYQADWLLRFYGFEQKELITENGMLPLPLDPKMAWALAHPEFFPVDINRAAKEVLLRVPGLGAQSVARLLATRRARRVRKADIERLGAPTRKVLAFVQLPDHRPGRDDIQRVLQPTLPPPSKQGDLFQAV